MCVDIFLITYSDTDGRGICVDEICILSAGLHLRGIATVWFTVMQRYIKIETPDFYMK